jgi:dihydropteroate synthase
MVPAPAWRLRDRVLDLEQPLAAGIVNVTADSMFAGARSGTPEQAVRDGEELIAAGFEMLDVGALAARSGPPVPQAEEAAALVPALRGLVAGGVPLSADTFSPPVAEQALAAGAAAINDISGGSEEMFDLIASSGCGYVLMHIEGPPRSDRRVPAYGDVVEHLRRWFSTRIEVALSRGVAEAQIVLDPGFDFDLDTDQDLELLRRLGELHDLGRPLYVSLSRKDFIGAVLAGSWQERWPAEEREWGTAAVVALAVGAGAQILRLHDRSSLQALRVAGRVTRPLAEVR